MSSLQRMVSDAACTRPNFVCCPPSSAGVGAHLLKSPSRLPPIGAAAALGAMTRCDVRWSQGAIPIPSVAAQRRRRSTTAAGTPFWKLVLKQFDDYLVKILIAAAVVDLVIALLNGERGAGCAICLSPLPHHLLAGRATLWFPAPSSPGPLCASLNTVLHGERLSQRAASTLKVPSTPDGMRPDCRSAFVEPGIIVLILLANGASLLCTHRSDAFLSASFPVLAEQRRDFCCLRSR